MTVVELTENVIPWLLYHPVAVVTSGLLGLSVYVAVASFGESLGWRARRRVLVRLFLGLLSFLTLTYIGAFIVEPGGISKFMTTLFLWIVIAPHIIVWIFEWSVAILSWVWDWSDRGQEK